MVRDNNMRFIESSGQERDGGKEGERERERERESFIYCPGLRVPKASLTDHRGNCGEGVFKMIVSLSFNHGSCSTMLLRNAVQSSTVGVEPSTEPLVYIYPYIVAGSLFEWVKFVIRLNLRHGDTIGSAGRCACVCYSKHGV